jgi:hypothetical protein
MDDEAWERLVGFLTAYRDCFDSLALVDDANHNAYHDMAQNRRVAEVFARRIAQLRGLGFSSVGIINLATLGHIDEGYAFLPQPLPPMTGYDGRASRTCLCPNDPACRAHIREEYALYAAAHPDFLWVDDDVKLHTNGIRFGCFCPGCVKLFREKYGHGFQDREALVEALDDPASASLRRDWVAFVSGSIESLLGMIEQTVHGVDASIETGFMTMRQSWSTYNGEDFPRWFAALKTVKARSGEGTYDESHPFQLVVKALDTAQQMQAYPESVRDRLYEVENFPYYRYQKSARFMASECALAAAQGFTGILVNALKVEPRPDFEDSAVWFDAIRQNRRQWDRLGEFTAPLRGHGFWSAISPRYDALRPLVKGDSFFRYTFERPASDVTRAYALAAAGLPLTADRESACGVILTGDMVNGFTDDILAFFRRGVILDGGALEVIEARGLGGYTGVKVARVETDGILERFNEADPVNRGIRDVFRDIRLAFWNGSGTALTPIREGVRAVSWLESYTGERLGIACSLYENELGGRVCVMGYGAFDHLDSAARHLQIRRIGDELTAGALAAQREAPGRLAHFLRTDGERLSAAFVNLYLDDQPPTRVTLRGMRVARLLTPNGAEKPLKISPEGEIELPAIRPFETVVVLALR